MTASAPRKNLLRLPVLLAAGLLLLAGSARSAPIPVAATPGRNEAEQWVASQVEAGEAADLEQHFPDKDKRVLHADFIQELLTGRVVPVEKSRRRGFRLAGAIFEEPVDLSNEQVGCAVQLIHCSFRSSANFDRTVFAGPVSFNRCEFAGRAIFRNATIGGNANFGETVFSGAAMFTDGSVSGLFYAGGAQFLSPDGPVDFVGMKIGSSASFDGAVFNGPANFYRTNVDASFLADGVQFKNKDRAVCFISLKVGASASFTQALFAGETDFGSAHITDAFVLMGAQFTHPDKTTGFVNLKVDHNFTLVGTVFTGPAEFNGTKVGALLTADKASFLHRAKGVSFLNAKVGGIAHFAGTAFAGPVNLGDSTFHDLTVTAPMLAAESIPGFGLVSTTITQNLHLENLHLRDLFASRLHVTGSTRFVGLQVDHQADLSDGNFAKLELDGSRWPAPGTGELVLSGTKYQDISAAPKEADSHEKLLSLVEQAAYTTDVYANLEAFFVRQGDREDADHVYVAGKTRERRENMNWHSFHFYWNYILQGIGYGRYPERALYACLAVVAAGCWLFKPSKMQRQPNEDGKRAVHYNRFWYSLENFLPLVELKAADAWEPKPTERFLRHYVRIHTLLGWVLIPIGLASVTGVIK